MLSDYIGYARISASGSGLNIKFHYENIQPHVDSKRTIHVQAPNMMWTEEQWEKWYYYLEHEIGHECEPWHEWKVVLKDKGVVPKSLFGHMMNLNSDQAQEHDRYGVYKGVDISLGEGRANFIRSGKLNMVSKDEADAKWNAVWLYDAIKRAEWNPLMRSVASDMTCDEQAQHWLDKLMAWGKSAADCRSEWEVYDYTHEMCTILELDPDENGGSGGEKGKDGEPCEDGEKGDEEGEGEGKGGTAKYSEFFEHDHGDPVKSSTSDLHIDYDEVYDTGYIPRDIKVVNFKTGENMDQLEVGHGRSYASISGGSAFGKSVRKLLQVKTQSRWQGGFKRGRVNSRSLHRTTTGAKDVFKQKVSEVTLQSAVSIGIDFSGSMGGEKTRHACHAAILLNDAISVLGIPTEMWGFTDVGDYPLHMIIKGYNERVTEDDLKLRFSDCSSRMYNNADGENLLYAAHQLARRPERNKVLVMLSDGSPAGSGVGCDHTFLKNVCSSIQDSGIIKLYGIGICDDNVRYFYKNRVVINRAEELEDKLLELVKTSVLESV